MLVIGSNNMVNSNSGGSSRDDSNNGDSSKGDRGGSNSVGNSKFAERLLW